MVRVLIVITNGLKREGITTTQLECMRYLDKKDLQIDFASVHEGLPEVIEEFKDLNCDVISLPDRYKHTIKYVFALWKLIKKNKYDVIHVHGSSSLMLLELKIARMNGVKVRIAHSRNTYCKSKKLDKLLRPFFYENYTLAMACGNDAGKFLFENRPFQVFHNGKDFSKFHFNKNKREKIRTELGLNNSLALGFVGRLNQQKNPIFLLDTFEKLIRERVDAKLVLIGDGERIDELKKYAAEKGIEKQVLFLGRIVNVDEVLQGLDIMLLPSLYEGLPNVVLEWQISGLRCLVSENVTKECAVTDLVTFLPIDKGVAPWVNAIKKISILQDRSGLSDEACEAMRENGFEISTSAAKLKEIYLKAVE